MQTHDTTLEEATDAHLTPPIIVGIAHHKARQGIEEVDTEVAVPQHDATSFTQVIYEYDDGRYAAQAIENLIARL